MVRIQPGPPHGLRHRGGLAQLGEHLLCKQGVVGSIPTSSTTHFTQHRLFTVASRHRPKRLSRNRRAVSVCHASGSCSLTIHGKRIEIVDGKSAGVKACQTPCRQRYYDCVNRYSSSKYANTTNLIGKRVNTQILTIQSVISVLDDATLVGWRQSYRVK